MICLQSPAKVVQTSGNIQHGFLSAPETGYHYIIYAQNNRQPSKPRTPYYEFCPKVYCSTIYTFARKNIKGGNACNLSLKTCVRSEVYGLRASVYAGFRLMDISRHLALRSSLHNI